MRLQPKLPSESIEDFGFNKIRLSKSKPRTTNVFSKLSRSWICNKIRLTDAIQTPSSLNQGSCRVGKMLIGSDVYKITVWRWFSFSSWLSYKTSESTETSQRRKEHTWVGNVSLTGYGRNKWMVWRLGKLMIATWGNVKWLGLQYNAEGERDLDTHTCNHRVSQKLHRSLQVLPEEDTCAVDFADPIQPVTDLISNRRAGPVGKMQRRIHCDTWQKHCESEELNTFRKLL